MQMSVKNTYFEITGTYKQQDKANPFWEWFVEILS